MGILFFTSTSVLARLPRPEDELAAAVAYENLEIEAQQELQDRTKAYEPEKVVGVDKRFQPKGKAVCFLIW